MALRSVCLQVLLLCALCGRTEAEMLYLHNAPESPGDTRYDYHWQVLRAALEATRDAYGDYRLQPAAVMNESRQLYEMKRARGAISVMVLDPTLEMERYLLPVRIPIDKGLLGYRVLLIRAEDQPRFSAVRTLKQLQAFSIGQGSDWSDIHVYTQAGFRTIGGSSYEGLFDMLMARRFDAFGRGVSEVLPELAAHRESHPQMRIEDSLLIYYPLPIYFWFSPTEEGRQLQQRTQLGMQRLVDSGELERMFEAWYGPTIATLQLDQRRLFTLENPNLAPEQPYADARLWYHPRSAAAAPDAPAALPPD